MVEGQFAAAALQKRDVVEPFGPGMTARADLFCGRKGVRPPASLATLPP